MANKDWNIWKSTPFDLWHCQLNFTLWCATAECGVAFEDQLQAKDSFLASLYWFHFYCTTRRILEELRITLPGDESLSGIRTTMTLGPTSGFALSSVCHQIQTGGRSWIMAVKASDHGAHT